MTGNDDLPKQELLIKLLRMTESHSDGEALTALRKANAFLKSAGWDWEKLINSKIKIIEDPFKNLGVPQGGVGRRPQATQAAPSTPPYAARPAPPPPQPPPVVKRAAWPLGINPNKFSGWCYCCGLEVLANAGVIFKPFQYNSAAPDDWKVACFDCNGTSTRPGATVTSYAANRRRGTTAKGKPKPSVTDLS
jgi:hypothetical protein